MTKIDDSGERPPFRADHVGSLLRPAALKAARERWTKGEIARDALREIEDRSIRDAVALQEGLGLRSVTDGEFRRASFHHDYLSRLGGVEVRRPIAGHDQGTPAPGQPVPGTRAGTTGRLPMLAVTTGALSLPPGGIEIDSFAFLKSITKQTAKHCIPSPTMLHFRGGREAVDRAAYPDMDGFLADVARVWREELAALARAGCTYVQLDDTNLAYLCDEQHRRAVRERGDDPDALPALYARLINEAIAGRPADMAVTIHLCRGNSRSQWMAEGGYEPVAEAMFADIAVDGFFLEYDDERSGDFAPLRFVPKGKKVVLGLVTSKFGRLEEPDQLKRRIDEAARYVPLDQLCLSPQCGFASHLAGNVLGEDEQAAKLALVVAVAREMWG